MIPATTSTKQHEHHQINTVNILEPEQTVAKQHISKNNNNCGSTDNTQLPVSYRHTTSTGSILDLQLQVAAREAYDYELITTYTEPTLSMLHGQSPALTVMLDGVDLPIFPPLTIDSLFEEVYYVINDNEALCTPNLGVLYDSDKFFLLSSLYPVPRTFQKTAPITPYITPTSNVPELVLITLPTDMPQLIGW